MTPDFGGHHFPMRVLTKGFQYGCPLATNSLRSVLETPIRLTRQRCPGESSQPLDYKQVLEGWDVKCYSIDGSVGLHLRRRSNWDELGRIPQFQLAGVRQGTSSIPNPGSLISYSI